MVDTLNFVVPDDVLVAPILLGGSVQLKVHLAIAEKKNGNIT